MANPDRDRTVHVTIVPPTGNQAEIVRYERAGKWFYESGDKRRQLSFAEAVAFAVDERPAVIWHERLGGGTRFDAAVRKARAAKHSAREAAIVRNAVEKIRAEKEGRR